MQQSTIFSILMMLVDKRKVSSDYIAERFSISKRTVSRYINVLIDAGVPVVSETGPHGGIALPDDYKLDKAFMSEAESIRLKAALERTANEFGDKVNLSLIEKLNGINKSRVHDSYAIKQSNLYIDCNTDNAEPLRSKIHTFSEAIDECRAVEIKYTDANGYVSFRTVEPYTIVFKEGAWYVYAMCKLRGDFRLFKLSRISDMRKTSKRFVKTESKLLEKLELEYYSEMYVDLEFEFFPTPSVTESIVEWLGAEAVEERGTKFVATAELPLTDSLIKRLLSFGSSIKIIKPTEIAEQLRDEAERMKNIYKDNR